jgi:hypothetical protein
VNKADGFAIADVDVGLLTDPKVAALLRRVQDQHGAMDAIGLYLSLVLASWAAGDRLTLEETAPIWWTEPIDDLATDLVVVGLIDADHRIPEQAWASYFLVAWERREKRRQSGAEGGRRSWESRRDKRRSSDGSATPNPTVRPSGRQAVGPTGSEPAAGVDAAASPTDFDSYVAPRVVAS